MEFQPGIRTERGYLALPASGNGPGVLVLHAWWGLNDFFVQLCDRFARAGFVALAPDLYVGAVASTAEEAEARKDELDPEATQKKLIGALDALRDHPAVLGERVGTVGFSLGGSWALELCTSRPESVAATVLFYGLGEGDFAASRCAYQGHFAENDVWDPIEYARLMEAGIRAAGREVTFFAYPGVGHWFFEADRPDAYDAASARLAWERTVPFLHTHLRVP